MTVTVTVSDEESAKRLEEIRRRAREYVNEAYALTQAPVPLRHLGARFGRLCRSLDLNIRDVLVADAQERFIVTLNPVTGGYFVHTKD